MKTFRLLLMLMAIGTLSVSTVTAQTDYDYLGIVGDATVGGWNASGTAFTQDPVDTLIFTYTGVLKPGKFKIHLQDIGDFCTGDWINAAVADQNLVSTAYIITTGCDGPDNQWVVSESGSYTITVDQGLETITIVKLDYYPALYLIGDASPAGWDMGAASPMTVDDTDPAIFRWAGLLKTGEFKISSVMNWDDGWDFIMPVTQGQALTENSFEIVVSGTGVDKKWVIAPEDSSNYLLTLDLENDTISFEAVNGDATLDTLVVSVGELSPAFDSLVTDYYVTVPDGTLSVDVTATLSDPLASMVGTGAVDVSSGSGVASVVVTADDGLTTKTYTVNISVGASSDATLSELTVSLGELTPAFDKTEIAYTVTVPEGTTSVDVSASATHASATLIGTGAVDVSSGSGVATIVVTAEDASTTKTYTVTITVEVPFVITEIYIVGSATPSGWTISTPFPFTVDAVNDRLFTWEGTLVPGELKFSTFIDAAGDWCNGTWILGEMKDQPLTNTTYTFYTGCPIDAEDYKWIVTDADTGTYIITIDLENETLDFELQIDDTGIEENDQSSISVYPNPANEYFTIDLGEQSQGSVDVYSIDGRKVYQNALNESRTRIDVKEMVSSGLLILRVSTEDKTETFRLLVQ